MRRGRWDSFLRRRAVGSRTRTSESKPLGEPIEVGSLHIAPGDRLHADPHSVSMLPLEIAAELPTAADGVIRVPAGVPALGALGRPPSGSPARDARPPRSCAARLVTRWRLKRNAMITPIAAMTPTARERRATRAKPRVRGRSHLLPSWR